MLRRPGKFTIISSGKVEHTTEELPLWMAGQCGVQQSSDVAHSGVLSAGQERLAMVIIKVRIGSHGVRDEGYGVTCGTCQQVLCRTTVEEGTLTDA